MFKFLCHRTGSVYHHIDENWDAGQNFAVRDWTVGDDTVVTEEGDQWGTAQAASPGPVYQRRTKAVVSTPVLSVIHHKQRKSVQCCPWPYAPSIAMWRRRLERMLMGHTFPVSIIWHQLTAWTASHVPKQITLPSQCRRVFSLKTQISEQCC